MSTSTPTEKRVLLLEDDAVEIGQGGSGKGYRLPDNLRRRCPSRDFDNANTGIVLEGCAIVYYLLSRLA
jgi:hypothetical protein